LQLPEHFSKPAGKKAVQQELQPSDKLDNFINHVNNRSLAWKANECLLRNATCEAPNESSLVQITDEKANDPAMFKSAWESLKSYRDEYADASSIPDDKVPASFDLRNIGGQDFTGGVRDQGGCGSCYSFSFLQVIESRVRQVYGKQVEKLSPQQLLSCNYMTEGCEGGWAVFNGFLAENTHLVAESCAPYEEKFNIKKMKPCGNFGSCPGIARVKKTYKLENPTEKAI
jgi:C1A family cysteine protease